MNRTKKSSLETKEKASIDLNNINVYHDDESKKSPVAKISETESSLNINIIEKSSKSINGLTETSSVVGGAKKDTKGKKSSSAAKSSSKKQDAVDTTELEEKEEKEETDTRATEKVNADITNSSFQTSLLHSPYIETSLRCPIMLNPTQMDNKLQLHLKSNLNNYTKGR